MPDKGCVGTGERWEEGMGVIILLGGSFCRVMNRRSVLTSSLRLRTRGATDGALSKVGGLALGMGQHSTATS